MRNLFSLALALTIAGAAHAAASQSELRVCANPNDLPFSNAQGQGFENKLADMVARDLGETVRYTWTDEHEHFIRKTLNAGKCDVLMGVPAGFDEVDTTQPYYTSGYVFVSREDRALHLSSMRDPRLHKLKIGMHVIGDDNTPPMEALSRQGITQNIVGYMIYQDSQAKGRSRLIDDVAAGKVDIAAVWGPLAGYYAQHANAPLAVTPITDTTGFGPLVFQYAMAMGVRKGDEALKAHLNGVVARRGADIRNLLRRYRVPLMEAPARAAG
jgi:quinoprotein dehydrogenase-associated probable ABC transporter substrate-binding protein